MSEKQGFLDAIEKDSLDMTTRKVFADWLDDHDEPELADFHRSMTVEKYTNAKEFLTRLCKGERTCVEGYGYRSQQPEIWEEITYEDVVGAGTDYVESGGEDFLVQIGSEGLRNNMDKKTSKRYWEAWAIVTSRPFDIPGEGEYGLGSAPFSCSC